MATQEELKQLFETGINEEEQKRLKDLFDSAAKEKEIDFVYEEGMPPRMESETPPDKQDEKIEDYIGAGKTEAALAIGTGMTTGLAASIYGGIRGVSKRIYNAIINKGEENPKKAAKLVEDEMKKWAEEFTYSPRTKAGQKATQVVAKGLGYLEPLGPLGVEAGAAGRAAKTKGATTSTKRDLTPTEESLVEAEKLNIPVMTSDLQPPKSYVTKQVQTAGERIPVAGTGGMRKTQQDARIKAIKDTMTTFGATGDSDIIPILMNSLSQKRIADIQLFSKLKKDVINKLSTPNNFVPMTNTINAINKEINALREIGTPSSIKAADELSKYIKPFKDKKLSEIENVRSDLGDLFEAPDLVSSRTQGKKSISKIYKAINEDMGNFIKNKGELKDFNKWRISNKKLSEMMGELESSALKAVLKKGSVKPEEVNRLLFSKNPSEIKLLYKNLDKEGRGHAKIAILNRAIDKAGGLDNLSPAKFRSELNKLSQQTNIFFKGQERQVINGLSKALSITKRADEFAANPPTGQQLAIPVGSMLLAEMLGGTGAGIAGGVTLGLAARVYESIPVKNALRRIAKAKEGTKEFDASVESLLLAVYAIQEENKEKEENKK